MSGQVALDAAFTYAWSFQHYPEHLVDEGLEPHMVKEAYLWGTESADVFVDVEDYLDLKVDSLSAHASQMQRRTPEDRLRRIKEGTAKHAEAVGLNHAEGFRRIQFHLGTTSWALLHT